MGGRYYTYLGPYLRIEEELVEVPGGKGHGCINALCGMYHRAYVTPFCAQCGGKNAEFEKPSESRFRVDSWSEFQEPTSEAFTPMQHASKEDRVGYWTPNHKREGSPEYIWSDSSQDEGVIELTSANIQQDIDWLQSAFAEEIAKAREVFGADKVSIHWGRIVHYS